MTVYLLDTHIVLWYLQDNPNLPPAISKLIEREAGMVFYSILCPWELAVKESKGRITLPEGFYETLESQNFILMEVSRLHVAALRTLPLLHHDPFDRMLVAQAKEEGLTLITRDKTLAAYPIKTLIA